MLSGQIRKGTKVTTAKDSMMLTESVQRLYEPLADEYREISECTCGDVVLLGGLKVGIPNIFDARILHLCAFSYLS